MTLRHRQECQFPEPNPAEGSSAGDASLFGDPDPEIFFGEMLSPGPKARSKRLLHYRADAVAYGREVLEVLVYVPYEVIFLDCQMPEMNGYEVARWIRQQEKSSGFIVLLEGPGAPHRFDGPRHAGTREVPRGRNGRLPHQAVSTGRTPGRSGALADRSAEPKSASG